MPRAKPLPLTPAEEAKRAALHARKKELEDEERELLAKARERVKKEQAKASKRERKAETFRYVLVGIVALKEAQADPAKMQKLIGQLARYYTTPRERAALEALGVPPLPVSPAPIEQDVTPPDTPPPAEIAAMPVQDYSGSVRMVRH